MARSKNAQVAVELFDDIVAAQNLNAATAWKAIAELLLSCEIWHSGCWSDFRDVVVFRESNDFKIGSAVMSRAEQLSQVLATQLGV